MARGTSDILFDGTLTKIVASLMTTEVRKEILKRLQGEKMSTTG